MNDCETYHDRRSGRAFLDAERHGRARVIVGVAREHHRQQIEKPLLDGGQVGWNVLHQLAEALRKSGVQARVEH